VIRSASDGPGFESTGLGHSEPGLSKQRSKLVECPYTEEAFPGLKRQRMPMLIDEVASAWAPKLYKGHAMRRILLSMLSGILLVGFAKAQQAETTGETAENVKKEALAIEEEQRKCFLSTTSSDNRCADWIRNHAADGILHFTVEGGDPRSRTKGELVNELESGQRKWFKYEPFGHVVHVYGDGGNGTLAVVTYNVNGDVELYGKRSSVKEFCIDIWKKINGQWWCVLTSTHLRNLRN
jgi:hypothetical protein